MASNLPGSLPKLHISDNNHLLSLSNHASSFIGSHALQSYPFPISLFTKQETPELWVDYENLYIALLAAGDDGLAQDFLERISRRFGPSNERVTALRGLYEEAVADDSLGLDKILDGYNTQLMNSHVNVPILKRRIALLCAMSRISEAISALVDFVDAFPTDAEAWCELSSLYECQGLKSQSIFCLEEALLVSPNAWNIHARLGEVLYASTHSLEHPDMVFQALTDSMKRFCRSIELCEDYVRGYYGLYLTSSRLLKLGSVKSEQMQIDGLPTRQAIQQLHDISSKKIQNLTSLIKIHS